MTEVDAKHEWWKQVSAVLGKETNLENFKNWEAVRAIPLYRDDEFHAEYADEVIDMLNASPYKQEWFEVMELNESRKGHSDESWAKAQTDVLELIPTTGVMLKNMHHILTFESLRGKSVLDYGTIVELGSGIGEMARMIKARGFRGDYHVVDFPEISRLAQYTNDNTLITHDTIASVPDGLDNNCTLFIATWSLSETPMDYRDEVGKKLKGCDSLILSQSVFKELESNIPYFMHKWPEVNGCFYRLKQLEFHSGDGGNMYIICAGDNKVSKVTIEKPKKTKKKLVLT